ncbi:hypothetical protein [Methylobacterium radiotolerans]|uniref:hypothetical protein n=1 Tax=Methylobacterium radiotolerans TaxID=31998 RepID=UPI0038D2244E
MLEKRPRPFRGMMAGTRDEGYVSLEFVSSGVALHACPIWSMDRLLELPAMLGPGLYILVGMPLPGSTKLRAVVGESGMLQERLAAHAADPALDFVWDACVATGPRVMNETVRLILQRTFVDEIANHGFATISNRQDAERFTATEHDIATAAQVTEDLRPLLDMAMPGLVASVEPVKAPIGARAVMAPRGLDPLGLIRTTHTMRWRGALATATMRGGETVLLPGSRVVADVCANTQWLREKRIELIGSGVLVPGDDARYLTVAAFVTFRSAREATAFVTGGASASARLTWMPVDEI